MSERVIILDSKGKVIAFCDKQTSDYLIIRCIARIESANPYTIRMIPRLDVKKKRLW